VKIGFTVHAQVRLAERSSLSVDELRMILEQQLYVPLGRDHSRVHKLFYSQLDGFWLVAIHDEETLEVVTVLPMSYHNRWRISPDALEQSRRILCGEPKSEPSLPQESEKAQAPATTFRFSARFEKVSESGVRTVNLGAFPRIGGDGLEVVMSDQGILQTIRERISERLLSDEKCVTVSVRIGNRGEVAGCTTLIFPIDEKTD